MAGRRRAGPRERRQFKKHANRTRTINIKPTMMRGGIRM